MRRSNLPSPDSRALVADRLRYLLGDQDPGPVRDRPGRDRAAESADIEDGDAGPPPLRRFHRLHVAIVTVLVLLGLLGAGWTLLRSRPVAVADPRPAVMVSTPSATGAPSSTGRPERARIVVHVAGAVRRPGLVQLAERSRVQDAIAAAGGLTRAARTGRLNLAQVLSDGQQVLIGTAQEPVTEVRDGGPPAAGGTTPSAAVDLNHATPAELEQLPGVGPVTAANIVGWREQHGRFGSVSELQQVDGIGPKTYARIAPHVRV